MSFKNFLKEQALEKDILLNEGIFKSALKLIDKIRLPKPLEKDVDNVQEGIKELNRTCKDALITISKWQKGNNVFAAKTYNGNYSKDADSINNIFVATIKSINKSLLRGSYTLGMSTDGGVGILFIDDEIDEKYILYINENGKLDPRKGLKVEHIPELGRLIRLIALSLDEIEEFYNAEFKKGTNSKMIFNDV